MMPPARPSTRLPRLLGLPYPGGAALRAARRERAAAAASCSRGPCSIGPGLDFSFSGLKTAALVALRGRVLDDAIRADVARGFQEAVVDTLAEKVPARARERPGIGAWSSPAAWAPIAACASGWPRWSRGFGAELHFPRTEFCTDNGAMIALAGCMRIGGRHASRDGRAGRIDALGELGRRGHGELGNRGLDEVNG